MCYLGVGYQGPFAFVNRCLAALLRCTLELFEPHAHQYCGIMSNRYAVVACNVNATRLLPAAIFSKIGRLYRTIYTSG